MEALQAGGRPDVPEAGDRAWSVFWTLDRRRQGNGYGANAISHQEIAACAGLYGVQLKPWEMNALDAMERARLRWLNRDEKAEPQVATAEMTPDTFRALFGG